MVFTDPYSCIFYTVVNSAWVTTFLKLLTIALVKVKIQEFLENHLITWLMSHVTRWEVKKTVVKTKKVNNKNKSIKKRYVSITIGASMCYKLGVLIWLQIGENIVILKITFPQLLQIVASAVTNKRSHQKLEQPLLQNAANITILVKIYQ